MTILRKLTSITAAAAIAVGSLGAIATSAEAGPRGHGHAYHDHGHGHYKKGYRGGRDRYYGRHYHKKRDNTGKYVAIGVGALMLGILASEAARR
jgi:hypothetical protein